MPESFLTPVLQATSLALLLFPCSYIVAAGVLDVDSEGFYQAALGGVNDPVENAHRVMAFAQDMMLCAREVRLLGLQSVGTVGGFI